MSEITRLLDGLNDLIDSWGPVSEGEIDAFEKDIGAKLPAEYREFLLVRNGGELSYRNSFAGTTIDVLYGLGATDDGSDLRESHATFHGRVAEGFLVIGASDYTMLCLCLETERRGQVYVWDRGHELTQTWEHAAELLCESFRDFLRGLVPSEYKLEELADDAEDATEPFRSIILNDTGSVERYLADGGAVDCRDAQGRTPLMVAVESRPHIACLLIEAGADIAAKDGDGRTALHHAADDGSIDAVRLLLEHGADPLHADYDGINALFVSARTPRTLDQIRAHLEKQRISVDYEAYRKAASRYEIVRTSEIDALYESLEDRPVFFNNAPRAMAIDDSGFAVLCLFHPAEDEERSRTTLSELVELVPCVFGDVNVTTGIAKARYGHCTSILASVAKEIMPSREGVTLGEVASCVRSLYQTVLESTEASGETEIYDGLPTVAKQQIADSLRRCLNEVCAGAPTEDEDASPPAGDADPGVGAENILFRKTETSARIEGSGFAVRFMCHPMDDDDALVRTPVLSLIAGLEPIIVYQAEGMDEDADEIDLREPVAHARYEVCRTFFGGVADRVVVSRRNATVGDVAQCVQVLFNWVVERTSQCRTDDDVYAEFSPATRAQFERTLAECFRLACGG